MSTIINGTNLPNIPWEERPAGCNDVVWRYSANPIIPRDAIPGVNSIFNSAVVPFEGKFAGVFRCDDKARVQRLHTGFSDDAIHWTLDPEPIQFECDDEDIAMVSRPSDTSHTPFGDIFYSESPDMKFWGKHRWVMGPTAGWQSVKIGAGPIPIETTAGWLMIYHGVLESCNGFVYSFGAALLDIDQPWKVRHRTKPFLLAPWEDYECVGDVPNVAFPCAALADAESGRLAIYYGAADTVVALCFAQIDELIEFIQANSDV